jgi:putative PIN family toxin of toxin-antitoxin system
VSKPAGRFVLDTNTLVSAFLFPESAPGKTLSFVLSHGQLLMSLDLATELAEVLRREKFDRYLTRKRREELVAAAIRQSYFVAPTAEIAVCRDPEDNKVLELSVDGSATALVTGDADLRALHPFQGIPILGPRDFLSHYAVT